MIVSVSINIFIALFETPFPSIVDDVFTVLFQFLFVISGKFYYTGLTCEYLVLIGRCLVIGRIYRAIMYFKELNGEVLFL